MKQYKIITLILMLLTSGNMLAEELDTLKVVDVEEILVIAAPKENRKLREQPTAVTLLSQQDMQAAQVNSIKNLTGLVPNMFIPDYGSRLTSAVYIRGIGSRINTPSIGLYVDNIPYIDKSAFDFDYSDIERIDVLRGPQGTLYGRNAMGGLIKIHTKSPFSYQGTDFRMGAGTHNAYNTSLTHYHRVSERFAFSTGGFYDYEGGFFRNAALNNKKIDKGQSAGGLSFIYLLVVQGGIAEETAFVVIEAAGGEGETLGYPVVMGQRGIVGIVRACTHAEVCPLIGERRFGVDLNQSPHCIAPVQCSLRAAQHVNAFDVGVVEVESGLVDVGDIVHIQADGGCVDA